LPDWFAFNCQLTLSGVGAEKVGDRNVFSGVMAGLPSFLSPQLRGGFRSGGYRSGEEPHEPLDVLGHGRQEELLRTNFNLRRRRRRNPI
jgi:hypothetical protein